MDKNQKFIGSLEDDLKLEVTSDAISIEAGQETLAALLEAKLIMMKRINKLIAEGKGDIEILGSELAKGTILEKVYLEQESKEAEKRKE